MNAPEYTVRAVAEITGLSPHVLRVWERRYQAVTPRRSDSNRRLYAESEVRRLELLATLTKRGHGISQIAKLPLNDLSRMAGGLKESEWSKGQQSSELSKPGMSPEAQMLEDCWGLVVELDPRGLRVLLEAATLEMGANVLAMRVIAPLISRIGEGWESGAISIAEEHAASAVLKEFLLQGNRPFAESANAPCLVVTTPAGQLHELGAVLVTSMARRAGWSGAYMGPSLPAEEIARAAVRGEATAVAISIVYPADDSRLPDELRNLRRFLPDEISILTGGRAVDAYRSVLDEIGAELPQDMDQFLACLARLRSDRGLNRSPMGS